MLQFAELKTRGNLVLPFRFWELKIQRNEFNKFSVNVFIHYEDHPDIISIPISDEKLEEIILNAPINKGKISKYMSFIEDTETGLIEPYFSDSKEVKSILKRDALYEESLRIGDKIDLFSEFYYTFYYLGTSNVNGKTFIKTIAFSNNQTISRNTGFRKEFKSFKDANILRKRPGLSDEEILICQY